MFDWGIISADSHPHPATHPPACEPILSHYAVGKNTSLSFVRGNRGRVSRALSPVSPAPTALSSPSTPRCTSWRSSCRRPARQTRGVRSSWRRGFGRVPALSQVTFFRTVGDTARDTWNVSGRGEPVPSRVDERARSIWEPAFSNAGGHRALPYPDASPCCPTRSSTYGASFSSDGRVPCRCPPAGSPAARSRTRSPTRGSNACTCPVISPAPTSPPGPRAG